MIRGLRPATAVVVVCAACGGDGGAAVVTVRDSAGVEIVENHREPATVAEWRLGDVPALDIGVLDGDSSYQLFRVLGAARLDDGHIVIANSGTSELRFYDAHGRHLQSVGRRGEGPGEFRGLFGVWRYGSDSLIAWDERLRRVTVFDLDGSLGRVSVLKQSGFNPNLVAPFGDGSLFVVYAVYDISGEGPQQQYANYLRFTGDGEAGDSVGRFPTVTTIPIRRDGRAVLIGSPIFGARTSVAGSGTGFVVASGHEYEVTCHGPDGTLRRVVRWTGEDRTVSPADVERHREAQLARARDENARRTQRAILDQSPVQDVFPALQDIRIDHVGNVWVRAYDRPGYEGPARWLVFDPDGVLTARVETPERLRVFDIGQDYVLGIFRDELDVEHARVYELIKPGGGERS